MRNNTHMIRFIARFFAVAFLLGGATGGVRAAAKCNNASEVHVCFGPSIYVEPETIPSGTVSVGIFRLNNTCEAISVDVKLIPESALANEDYEDFATVQTLRWEPGQTGLMYIPVKFKNDNRIESLERFFVRIVGARNSVESSTISVRVIGSPDAYVYVVDDDSSYAFNAPFYSINEADPTGRIRVPVTRTGTLLDGQSQTISFFTSPITASPGEDYSPVTGTLVWTPSDPQTKYIEVPILNDRGFEESERFYLSISTSTDLNASLGNPHRVVVTILDNDSTPDNTAPVVFAGPDQIVSTTTVQLNGHVTDDGLPNGTLTTLWQLVSGPGPVEFKTPGDPFSGVTLSVPGTYVFRLTGNDGQTTAFDEVTIVYDPNRTPNVAPFVDAGVDLAVSSSVAKMNGSILDDGRPNGTLTARWEVVSGPGNVIFSSTNSVNTDVYFSQPGEYVLRLVGSDGELSSSDEVMVIVSPASSSLPDNLPPTVNAGEDIQIAQGDQPRLNGVVTDDGKPSGTLTRRWEKVSGPGDVFFSQDDVNDPVVRFTAPGTYVLRLVGSDGVYTISDEIVITVSSPSQNVSVDDFKNIFDPSTGPLEFNVSLNVPGHVQVRVFDHLGDFVKTVVDRDFAPGTHPIQWDGSNLKSNEAGSGNYVLMFDVAGNKFKKRVVLVRLK